MLEFMLMEVRIKTLWLDLNFLHFKGLKGHVHDGYVLKEWNCSDHCKSSLS